jgi:hypothetical protein
MDRKILLLSGLIFVTVLIAGCVQQLSKDEIQFTDMNEQLNCIGSFDLLDDEFILNSEQEYQSLLNYSFLGTRCENYQLPSIDFSQYTLLGKYTQGGGCTIDFVRKIYKDESDKKITYSIKVDGKGFCKKLGMSMNWVLIPKFPSDYTVEFEVK